MKRYLFGLTAALVVGLTLTAASATESADCAKISDPDSRLNCYDRLFRVTAPTPEPVSGVGEWSVSTQTSKIDDSKNVYVSLDAKETIRGRYGDKVRMSLTIACRENVTSRWFNFGGHHMSDYQHGTVTYRIDDKTAQRKRFRESTDNEALGLWNGGTSIPFLMSIMTGKNLLIRATPYGESPVESEFAIAGLDNALKSLREACRW